MAASRRWSPDEDRLIEKFIVHKGVHSTIKALHMAGFSDRNIRGLAERCKALGVRAGEGNGFIRVIDVDSGHNRSGGKERFTRKSVLSQAEADGVLRRVPYGPNGKTIPYVPEKWADAYVERMSKATNGEEIARHHIRRSWLPTKALPDLFGISMRTIERHIPAAVGDKGRRHKSYRYSVRPYLDAIPKQRVGRAVYWEPSLAEVNAASYKRTLPPVRG